MTRISDVAQTSIAFGMIFAGLAGSALLGIIGFPALIVFVVGYGMIAASLVVGAWRR